MSVRSTLDAAGAGCLVWSGYFTSVWRTVHSSLHGLHVQHYWACVLTLQTQCCWVWSALGFCFLLLFRETALKVSPTLHPHVEWQCCCSCYSCPLCLMNAFSRSFCWLNEGPGGLATGSTHWVLPQYVCAPLLFRLPWREHSQHGDGIQGVCIALRV